MARRGRGPRCAHARPPRRRRRGAHAGLAQSPHEPSSARSEPALRRHAGDAAGPIRGAAEGRHHRQ